jgi:isopentenyl diphosphate isomerase/L-lactate dehydrogenase-like FMN-dependent dehydrogenase
VAGEDGVRHVLKNILAELDLTLALCGLTRPAELDRAALARR